MYKYDSISKIFCTFFKDIITSFHTILLQMFYLEPNTLLLTETPSILNNLKFGYNLNQNPKKWIHFLNWLHLSWCIHIWKNQYIASTYKVLESLKAQHKIRFFFFILARQPPSGPWPPHSRGFYITHNDAPQSVGLLWTSDWLVAETSDNTQHSQQTDIHAPGGIWTHNLSRQAAADLRLRPHGHWDQP